MLKCKLKVLKTVNYLKEKRKHNSTLMCVEK